MSNSKSGRVLDQKRPFVGRICLPEPLIQFAIEPEFSCSAEKMIEAIYDIAAAEIFPEFPGGRSLMQWLHRTGLLVLTADEDYENVSAELTDQAKKGLGALREATEFLENPIIQQPCSGSHYRSLKQSFLSNDLATLGDLSESMTSEFFCDETVGIFVTRHDWASIFRHSEIGDKIDIRLPFDRCVFEFQISGKRVVALVSDDGIRIALKCIAGWLIVDPEMFKQAFEEGFTAAELGPLNRLINDQINAALVALDSGVAESETIVASDKVQAARARKGSPPIPPYRIVNLARRYRGERNSPSPLVGRESPRLHFRRGHWRQVSEIRKWINWTLVGDPYLGFVDKHYRL